MKKLLTVVVCACALGGCAMFRDPPEPKPETGTYEYWGRVNGKEVFLLWIDGRAYAEKDVKAMGKEWNPPSK